MTHEDEDQMKITLIFLHLTNANRKSKNLATH